MLPTEKSPLANICIPFQHKHISNHIVMYLFVYLCKASVLQKKPYL